MSRKLLFAAGILVCFGVNDCKPSVRDCMVQQDWNQGPLLKHLKSNFAMTPLEILAQVMIKKKVDPKVCRGILDSYNEFLGLLGQKRVRKHMEKLTPHKAPSDSTYARFQKLGRAFHKNIVSLLYHQDKGLQKLTEWYGVF